MDKLMKFFYISQIMLKIFCNYIVLKNMLFVNAKLQVATNINYFYKEEKIIMNCLENKFISKYICMKNIVLLQFYCGPRLIEMEVTAWKPVRAHGRLAKARISAAVVRLHRDKGAQLAGEQVFHHQVKHLEVRQKYSAARQTSSPGRFSLALEVVSVSSGD